MTSFFRPPVLHVRAAVFGSIMRQNKGIHYGRFAVSVSFLVLNVRIKNIFGEQIWRINLLNGYGLLIGPSWQVFYILTLSIPGH
jgi:hypothetical protein